MTRQVFLGSVMMGITAGIILHSWQLQVDIPIVYAQEPEAPREVLIEVVYNWDKERINQEIEEQAQKYGVSASEMKRVIQCESQGSTTIQSFHRYTFTDAKRGVYEGERELSFGLSQIHLPHHPTISREDAINPKFAINFMAKNWNKVTWSCK